jgi:hypothetical protein
MVSLRILCAKLSTVGIGKKDHSKQSDTQVALRRTLQIGHRSGKALKKIAGPSVRVYTVLWSHGSHLNNNCNINIGRAHLNAQFQDAIFRGMSAGFDRFIQHEQQFIEAELQ